MSVLIEGIELPKENQRGLWVVIHADGTVEYNSGDEGWKTLKQAALPVPKHGRLIDVDELPLEENVPTVMMHDSERWISAYELAMAPTVIPAEEEDGC